MPTGLSWTELDRSVDDLRAVLRFRAGNLDARARRRLRIGAAVVLLLTVAATVVPAYVRGALHAERVGEFLPILPTLYLGFLFLTVLTASASGGGREILPRDQAVAFPLSSTTDHFGALLMAPLNVAWLMQAWALLGLTAYVLGPSHLWATVLPVLLWLALATAVAQVFGWLLEWVRRGPHGIGIARAITAAFFLLVAGLVVTHRLTDVLDKSPTVRILLAAAWGSGGNWWPWARFLLEAVLATAVVVALGAVPARWALQRQQREELRLESGVHPAKPRPRSDLVAMLRVDRSAIWRSVPLRRGLLVLAFMPGLVAFSGHLEWRMIIILPGLVVSGGALLFGVNTWCLDGRGALWRDSLPAAPSLAFVSRVLVLYEVLLVSAALTIVLAALRAGTPTTSEVVALACATLVVAAQVVRASMAWSVRRPFAVDLRSARATPAPPVVMVGYSARLALSTTVTGMVFSGLAMLPDWRFTLMLAVTMLLWSSYRLARTATAWTDPVVRSRIVATVAS
ncbi:MAG TPA: hypothetical protein VFM09_04605 [Marmoricola sp.]|nr:hypothetical protein [Marmoricola sp.]